MIQQILNIDNYATEKRKARRKGSKSTQEFFTSYEIVKRMADKVPEEYWETALRTCYGVELMQDNVSETHSRVFGLLDALNIDYDKDTAMDIMYENLVCSDFFEWDFENWKPKNK